MESQWLAYRKSKQAVRDSHLENLPARRFDLAVIQQRDSIQLVVQINPCELGGAFKIQPQIEIVVIAAIAALSYAAPVFAQSFNRTEGTGNELPSYYDQNGGLHAGIAPQHNQIVVRRSGLNAFASVGRGVSSSDTPANTGGGSIGYNEMLQNDQW